MAPQTKEGIYNFWRDLQKALKGFTNVKFIDKTAGKEAEYIFIIFEYKNRFHLRAILPSETWGKSYNNNLKEVLRLPDIKIIILFPDMDDLQEAEKFAIKEAEKIRKP